MADQGARVPDTLDRQRLLQAQLCTNMRLRRAARALTDFYDLAMAASGLHSNQFTLLIPPYLKPGLTISQLAQLTGLDRTTLARNLELLERRQLLTLRTGEDQRTRVIHVTELGRQAIERALPLWEQAQQSVTTALGEAHVRELYAHLDVLEGLPESLSSR
jgi:DNA-binding MarR family transcriptional regulator